jgi:spermidine/putrescine-binding protein
MVMKRPLSILLVLMMATAACGDSSSELAAPDCATGEVDGDLDLHNWTDYIDPELVTAFETEFGVSVNETFYDSNEAMLPQVEAGGNDYDLIVPSDYTVTIMAEEGLLFPLQRSALPNIDNIDPLFRGAPYDPDDEFSVPYQWGTTGIGYAYAVVPEDWEPSWEIFFDPAVVPEATGAMSFLNDPRETMAAALKYLGYSVNSTSQEELDEAVALLRGVKNRVTSFVTDGTEDLLVEGETVAAHGYSGDFFLAFDEASTDDYDAYEDFAYGIPKEGGVAWVDTIAVPRTANAPCTAHTFINFLLEPENGAALSNYNFYASPNAAAEPFIDPEILEDETIYPSDEVLDRLEFIQDTGDFETNYTDAFSAVKN